jgi:hypothetical protein
LRPRSTRISSKISATIVPATVALLAITSSARAVLPAAVTLFQEGRRLMATGDTAQACASFAKSYALEASSGILLNLALCHETEGRTATAWAEYRSAARLARNQGREDRAMAADTRAAALEPRLARLTVVLVTPLPGLEVAGENGPISEHDMGVSVPIDPGFHQVRASAPGRRPWTTALEIKEGEQRTLEIPALEVEAKPTPMPEVPPGKEAPPALIGPGPSPPRAGQWHRSSFDLYAVGGGGILLLAGTVVYGIAYARLDSAIAECNQGPGCSESDRNSRVSTIDTLKYVGIGAWIAGGTLAVASGLHYRFRKAKTPVTVAIDPRNEAFSIQAVF